MGGRVVKNIRDRKRVGVTRYVHKASHRLKKLAGRFDVAVVFRKSNCLGAITNKLERLHLGKTGCQIKHAVKFRSCRESVVYKIPLSCGKVYIGETSRCINTRLREHKNNSTSYGSSLIEHKKVCSNCKALFKKTEVLKTCRGRGALLFEEARQIRKFGDQCVSFPSVYYCDKIHSFLEG